MNKLSDNLSMDLFEEPGQVMKNWLHKDGTVNYYGIVFSDKSANACYQYLLTNTPWQHDESALYGKHIVTKRKVAWYSSSPFNYSYSNTNKMSHPWTPLLLQLKEKVELVTGESYNSCLINLYHNESEGVGWHSDNEKSLKPCGAIASLTLGAERRFSFKHKKSQETINLLLQHGSVLVMKDEIQQHWVHRLPAIKQPHSPRINLTFRTVIKNSI